MQLNRVRELMKIAAVIIVPTASTPCVVYAQDGAQEFRAALIADLQAMCSVTCTNTWVS